MSGWVWAGLVVAGLFVTFTACCWLHARDKEPTRGKQQ